MYPQCSNQTGQYLIKCFRSMTMQIKHLRGRADKSMNNTIFCQGSRVQSSATSIFFSFFFFSRFSLIPSQSASLYIIASFEVYLIAENNYPHIGQLVVLFQKSSTVQYILMPSISDMPLLYSISSLKSMTDMRGSSNFRLRGREGGRTESDRKKRLCQRFGPQTYLQWVHRPQHVNSGINCQYQRNCTFWFQRGSNIFQGWGSNAIAYSL